MNDEFKKVFEINGKIYGYDFDCLTVEQVELALTVGEFRLHQKEQEYPDSIDKLIRSRAAEYLSIISSYLFIPFNKEQQPSGKFESSKVREVELFFKSLPANNYPDVVRCINDFFSGIGMPGLGSTTKYSESKKNGTETLLNLLSRMSQITAGSKPSPEGTDAGTKESSD